MVGRAAGGCGIRRAGRRRRRPAALRCRRPGTALGDFGALHFAVQGAAGDRDRFEQRVRPRLSALAIELLWQRRGLDWRRDADQLPARAVLGPQSWALLTAPEHTLRLSPRSLDALLDELEAL